MGCHLSLSGAGFVDGRANPAVNYGGNILGNYVAFPLSGSG
ncbi:hypothetical protein CHELA1G11_13050 [Hyphomicrobiales bacterium]|nr:hypothetical protein CHELA1G2_11259 [Hyphomicrobiales bacterium]CAH1665476.1 hypothetical protein CHELA41_22670 [Hyphomicrobiales bacterium]CAH1668954.1 hypothetical protein CHELA1G11_13050 [Hyphomicrobiales bacterium]CAH1681313.1 hypothetical protein CHELA20_52249 [Hyphomicrobiales bacterium]